MYHKSREGCAPRITLPTRPTCLRRDAKAVWRTCGSGLGCMNNEILRLVVIGRSCYSATPPQISAVVAIGLYQHQSRPWIPRPSFICSTTQLLAPAIRFELDATAPHCGGWGRNHSPIAKFHSSCKFGEHNWLIKTDYVLCRTDRSGREADDRVQLLCANRCELVLVISTEPQQTRDRHVMYIRSTRT